MKDLQIAIIFASQDAQSIHLQYNVKHCTALSGMGQPGTRSCFFILFLFFFAERRKKEASGVPVFACNCQTQELLHAS